MFSNQQGGVFKIVVQQGGNTSVIMVPFLNDNATIIIEREIILLSLTSQNSSIINLNQNATIYSNNSIILTNSSLQGSGKINSSISSSDGSSYGNNDVTSLIISGYLNSNEDHYTFTLNKNGSTIISVGNNVTINNSSVVIRVSKDILDSKQNTTLITGSGFNGSGFVNITFKSYDPLTGEEEYIKN